MRARLCAVGAVAALMLGACGPAAAHGGRIVPVPRPSPRPTIPAADAGGACALLDYDGIASALGVRFDVAASAEQGETSTCVVRSSEHSLPDLLLTVSPTTADAAVFRSEMAPAGSRAVKALGKAAYRGTVKASKTAGPAAEVGWLASDERMLALRYTLPLGSPAATAQTMSTRLLTLAKRVDAART